MQSIAKKTGTNITIGKVRYRFNKNLTLKNLYIEDLNNDTLLFASKISLSIENMDIGSRFINLSSLKILGLKSKVVEINSNNYNFSFFLDSLKNDNNNIFNWDISCYEVDLNGGNVLIKRNGEESFDLANLNFKAQNISVSKHDISFLMNQFNFKIKNELELKKIAFSFHKQDNLISIRGFNLLTNKSHLNINKTKIIIPIEESNKPAFYSINVHSSKIFPSEFSRLFPTLNRNFSNIQLTGKVSGDIKNLVGEKINILIGDETSLNTDFIVSNLNQPKDITYDITIHEIFTNKYNLDKIIASIDDSLSTKVPKALDKLGNIFYTGKIKGSSHELRSNGYINCDLGLIETDLLLQKKQNKTFIDGNLKTMPLYIDHFLKDSSLGSLDIDLVGNGFFSDNEGVDIKLSGGISNIEYNELFIDTISINGRIKDKSFYGRISSYDPKIRFDFAGLVRLDSTPEYKFETNIYTCDLNALGIIEQEESSDLSLNLKANFKGNNSSNINGSLIISDVYYFTDSNYFATDTIKVKAVSDSSVNSFTLLSEFFNASIIGDIHPTLFISGLKQIGHQHLPSLIEGVETQKDTISEIQFIISADFPHPITEFLLPEYRISPGSKISGNYSAKNKQLSMHLSSDRLAYKNKALQNLNANLSTLSDSVLINLEAKTFEYSDANSLKNFSFTSNVFNDSVKNKIYWNNWLNNKYSGNINTLIAFQANDSSINNLDIDIDIFPSNIIMNDTVWQLKESHIHSDTNGTTFTNITIDNGNSMFKLDGKYSDNPNDSIDILVKNINLTHLNTIIKAKSINFGGLISGSSRLKDLKGEQKVNFDFVIDDFTINKSPVGQTHLISNWSAMNKQLDVHGITTEKEDTTFMFNGYISPSKNSINCDISFNNYDLVLLEAFLKPTFNKVSGRGTGEVLLSGTFPSPTWDGYIVADNLNLGVDVLKVEYTASDSIFLKDNKIILKTIDVFDRDSNFATINGIISHDEYKFFSYDIELNSDKILAFDTKYSDNPLYYGTAYGKGLVKIKGSASDLNIDIVATTLENTKLTIPLEGKGELQENDFISFSTPFTPSTNSKIQEKNEIENRIIKIEQSSTSLNINLTVTPVAEILIIFDPQVGDMLKATGNAELTMESKGDDFFMYGDYMIYKGDFIFTLQNVINKRLIIQPGSNVSWSGDPINANINLDAVYKIRRVTLGDLTQVEADMEKKIPVNCHLLMTNKLLNPEIKFMVDVPSTTNNEAVEQINSLSEDEINKQVLSLLLVNKFTPLPGLIQSANINTTTNLGATTASELLSNQLSNWMSQITTEFDVGFSYRPGDEPSEQEVEFALSTTFWDDRIAVNGNFGYNGGYNSEQNANTPYTTDFQVEFKLNKKGNIRLNAFQKVNNDYIYNGTAPYTQGIGIFYTEEFNDFDELIMKMFRKGTAKKPDETNEEIEDDKNTNNPEI